MTAPYLFDTNILIAYVRGGRVWKRLLAAYDPARLVPRPVVSVINVGELRSFAMDRGWGRVKKKRLDDGLAFFDVLPIQNDEIVDSYVEVDVWCKHHGRKLSGNDIWIATTAHRTGCHLLSSDKDFAPLSPLFFDYTWIDPH